MDYLLYEIERAKDSMRARGHTPTELHVSPRMFNYLRCVYTSDILFTVCLTGEQPTLHKLAGLNIIVNRIGIPNCIQIVDTTNPIPYSIAVMLNTNELKGYNKKEDMDMYSFTISRNNLPTRYIVNDNAVIVWFNDKKTVVKRAKEDDIDPVKGFLWAYFEATSGLSKTKANKYLKDVANEKTDGSK